MEHERKASYLPGNLRIASDIEYRLPGREVNVLIEKLFNQIVKQAYIIG